MSERAARTWQRGPLPSETRTRAKRDDVLRVSYDTPADKHIVCVDEKTGMQALERRYRDLPMKPGCPVRREFEYIRHGTLALMGAFDVCRGKLFGFVAEDQGAAGGARARGRRRGARRRCLSQASEFPACSPTSSTPRRSSAPGEVLGASGGCPAAPGEVPGAPGGCPAAPGEVEDDVLLAAEEYDAARVTALIGRLAAVAIVGTDRRGAAEGQGGTSRRSRRRTVE